jgi:hypothetical protein
MGIPFGCGSVVALLFGVGLWFQTGATWLLFAAAIPSLFSVGSYLFLMTQQVIKNGKLIKE